MTSPACLNNCTVRVETYGDKQDASLDDILIILGDTGNVHTIGDDTHDQNTAQHLEDIAASSVGGDTADNSCREDLDIDICTNVGNTAVQTAHQYDTAE